MVCAHIDTASALWHRGGGSVRRLEEKPGRLPRWTTLLKLTNLVKHRWQRTAADARRAELVLYSNKASARWVQTGCDDRGSGRVHCRVDDALSAGERAAGRGLVRRRRRDDGRRPRPGR